MKKKSLLLAAALAFAPAAASAQTAPAEPAPTPAQTAPASAAQAPAAQAPLPDADPALWVVRDEDTTIYLFGTFHLLDGRPWFNDEVRTAFDASQELVLEALIPDNPAELQPMIMRYAVDSSGRKLSERLSPEQNAALGRALAALGAPPAAFDNFKPWFVAMTLTAVAAQQLGINAANGPETVLIRAARERSIQAAELEGMERQIRMFDSMPEEQQLAQLRQALDNLEKIRETLAPMLAAWSVGDVEGLQRILDQAVTQDAALHNMMFTRRNAAWAVWIRERLKQPGTVFLAVGAGHLAGGSSVQSLLGAYGIRTERVPHAEAPAS